MNKTFRLKMFRPFNNRRGGFGNVFLGILGSVGFVIIISYITVRGMESFAQAQVDTLSYRLTDAIASSGEINDGIQEEIYKGFNKLKFYTGDYKIEVYKYDYKNHFSKEFVGSSSNGDKLPTTSVPRGQMIQVIYSCEETTLDKVVSILNSSTVKVGLSSSSSAKVE